MDRARIALLFLALPGFLMALPPRLSGADCNQNGTEDFIEITSGATPDCNRNGVPDACDLQRVNYAALDADGRAQFDIARRFMQQADDALKGGNLPFAGKLADKAATMASVLVR